MGIVLDVRCSTATRKQKNFKHYLDGFSLEVKLKVCLSCLLCLNSCFREFGHTEMLWMLEE